MVLQYVGKVLWVKVSIFNRMWHLNDWWNDQLKACLVVAGSTILSAVVSNHAERRNPGEPPPAEDRARAGCYAGGAQPLLRCSWRWLTTCPKRTGGVSTAIFWPFVRSSARVGGPTHHIGWCFLLVHERVVVWPIRVLGATKKDLTLFCLLFLSLALLSISKCHIEQSTTYCVHTTISRERFFVCCAFPRMFNAWWSVVAVFVHFVLMRWELLSGCRCSRYTGCCYFLYSGQDMWFKCLEFPVHCDLKCDFIC